MRDTLMRPRIRAAALIVRDSHILLVGHYDTERQLQWWVPPGGGMEPTDRDTLECVRREVREETGCELISEPHLVYIREFHDVRENYHHLELFFTAAIEEGRLHQDHDPGDGPSYLQILEARWVHRKELDDLKVYPEILYQDRFWQAAAEGFPTMEYLGCEAESPGVTPT